MTQSRRALQNIVLLGVAVVLVLVLASSGRSSEQTAGTRVAPDTSRRIGYDPLSTQEQQRALGLAREDAWVASALSASRHELLQVRRHDEPKPLGGAAPQRRRADVLFYLYESDELLVAVVDLKGASPVRMEQRRGEQPPITTTETARALGIVLDGTDGEEVARRFRTLTGHDIETDRAAFRVAARVFRPRDGAAPCRTHRCADLFLVTVEGHQFPVGVVDLSSGAVVSVVELGR